MMATAAAGRIVITRVVQYVIVEVPVMVKQPYAEAEMEALEQLVLEDGPNSPSEVREESSKGNGHGNLIGHKFEREMAARMALIGDLLREKLQASWANRAPRLPGWLRAGRNLAVHDFGIELARLRVGRYCSLQRGRRRKQARAPRQCWRQGLMVALAAAVLAGATLGLGGIGAATT